MKNKVELLNDFSWSYRTARVLHTANALDIFTHLADTQMSAQQICQVTKTDPAMTEKLLIACAAMGLLERKQDKYSNTELARTFLVRSAELYQGNIIAHSASCWDFWSALEDTVRSGVSTERIKPDDFKNFIMGMHNIAVAGRAQIFLDAVDLSGRKKLFDVGGGPGSYSIAACRRYPNLRAVVFDLPETIEIAARLIAKENMQDRVATQPGSWDTDDFGRGNDVVLLSNILHGPNSNARMKLKKAYDSMLDGGLLIVQDFLLNDAKTGPLIPALFNIMVGTYSKAELLKLIGRAGFSGPAVVADSETIGCTWITAKKPR
ncbi:MAG: methyltransferase [Planctomycetota bacterium]|jgi:hypothetical protein